MPAFHSNPALFLYPTRKSIPWLRTFFGIGLLVWLLGFSTAYSQNISFNVSQLDFNGYNAVNQGTFLQYGPDGRLYVVELDGTVRIFTVQKTSPNHYKVIGAEVLTFVKSIPNHNDDGTLSTTVNREATSILVVGTATNPVIYVSSSDPRVGGPSGDSNLDTNSGIITRMTWTGTAWVVVDIVRGLPRSEENHASHAMEYTVIQGVPHILLCQGGHTNAGSPSTNFAWSTEYALTGAILTIDLNMINALPVLTDPVSGRKYIYNLPTLDDPTRSNVNGINNPNTPGYNGQDPNDPFGGNDGLNQAKLVIGGPVQIFSAGYRNTYDLVVTENGMVYNTDNGANGGWGGFPQNEGLGGNVTNNFRPGEPGSSVADGGEAPVNNKDHLTLVTNDIQNYTSGGFYGGHPNPVRANPTGAGLFTRGTHSSDPGDSNGNGYTDDWFRNSILPVNDPNFSTRSLPVDWPPVPVSVADIRQGDFRNPGDPNPDGPADAIVTLLPNNSNGIDEYTANAFGGALKGNLIIGKNNGVLHRVIVNADGSFNTLETNFVTGLGSDALGVTCNSDTDPFAGTIWVASFDEKIWVLEPNQVGLCYQPTDPAYDGAGDYDGDGYSNDDEFANGTNLCSAGSRPTDFDSDFVSDLLDLDDDNDGINDNLDPFQMGIPFNLPVNNELFSSNPILKGYQGLGLTGLMNNGAPNPNYLDWVDHPAASSTDVDDIYGGAVGGMTIYQTAGDAFTNNQEKAYQYGVNVDSTTGTFLVMGRMLPNFKQHLAGESQGMYIGTGFQDNYLKIILTGTQIAVAGENAGAPLTGLPAITRPAIPANLEFYFRIEATTGMIQAQYSTDNGATKLNIGSPFAATGAVLQAIKKPTIPLAVGMIGTSAGNPEFAANWDFLKVFSTTPVVEKPFVDLIRVVNTSPEVINLDDHFNDDAGITNLTYSLVSNSEPAIAAVLVGNLLTITYPALPDTAYITLRATDQEGAWVEGVLQVDVVNPDQPIFRVNTGGPTVTALDGNIDWVSDIGATLAVQGFEYINGDNVFPTPVNAWAPSVPLSIQQAAPLTMMGTERWDVPAGDEMQYTFQVGAGSYRVRLFLREGYYQAVGKRSFSIKVEGQSYPQLTNVDPFALYGLATGGVVEINASTTDDLLAIEFIHGVENPLICGIEILPGLDAGPAIVVQPVYDQTNDEGDNANITVIATGGQGNLLFSATGLPAGVTIDQTNGLIGGTIATNAGISSPYHVVVTVDDSDGDVSDIQIVSFNWTINGNQTFVPKFRVNTGGPTLTALDGGINWITDIGATLATQNFTYINGDNLHSSAVTGWATGASTAIQQATPIALFTTERWDPATGGEMKYSFNVVVPGTYLVRLFIREGYYTTANKRSFSVLLDGVAYPAVTNIDPTALYGSKIGAVIEVPVTIADAQLDIEFLHNIENTLICGIEILGSQTTGAIPIVLNAPGNQNSIEGNSASVQVAAFGGDGALTYAATGLPQGLTINAATGLISGVVATGAAAASPYTVSLTVDDADTLHTDKQTKTFTWTVIAPSNLQVLYRVNAGGPSISAIDGGMNWVADAGATLATHGFTYINGDNLYSSAVTGWATGIDAITQSQTPLSILTTERWDPATGGEMKYTFDVASAGTYVVRLFLREGYYTTTNKRVFSIKVDGQTFTSLSNIDLVATYGSKKAAMIEVQVNSTDNLLDMEFLHNIENTQVCGIEILGAAIPGGQPIVISTISDKVNTDGDPVTFQVLASGGQGALHYQALGLPAGLAIDSLTGVISGVIDTLASANSPYLTLVMVDDSDTSATDIATQTFVWEVGAPSPVPTVLFRVNAGGATLAAIDGGLDWVTDNGATLANNGFTYNQGLTYTQAVSGWATGIPAAIQSSTPLSLFTSERWDDAPAPELKYTFNVGGAGTYLVRIYMRNGWDGTAAPGTRVFNITVDGVVFSSLTNVDLSALFGSQKGGMIEVTATTADNLLDIEFLHVIQNPLVCGFEILRPAGVSATRYAASTNAFSMPFKAIAEKGGVFLSWTSPKDEAGTLYLIERSAGAGAVSLNTLSEVYGAQQGSYTFNDANPVPGTSYYRIIGVTPSGQSFGSEIEEVTYAEEASHMKVYPNPVAANETLYLEMATGFAGDYLVEILNLQGQVVKTNKVYLEAGQSEVALSVQQMATGLYLVRVQGQGINETQRVWVK